MIRTVALATLLTVVVCVPAQAAPTTRVARRARPASRVKTTAGALAPNGVALVTGALPHAVRRPFSFALSRDKRFGAGDVVLRSVVKKPKGGRFRAWVAIPDSTPAGRRNLLACQAARPTARGCAAAGTVKVGRAPEPRVANPVLDPAHATHTNLDFRGGTATATAADGTVFTVTVPQNSTVALDVALTPVTALTPENVVGRLTTGVLIGPTGDAPPGSTLTIRTPAALPRGAAVVGFGGVDPSGAAFRLPLKPQQTTTLPLTQFGGYGIAVAGRAPHAALARAACAPAHLAAAGSRPRWSCVSAAQVVQQLGDAVVASNFDPSVIDAAGQAALHAIDDELASITSRPPSEAGLAEMDAVTSLAIGVERQRELLGLGKDATTLELLGKGLRYSYDLYSRLCTQAQPRSDVRYAYGLAIVSLARQQQLLSFPLPGDLAQLFDRCVSPIHLQLDVQIDATAHTGTGLTGSSQVVSHVTEHVGNADVVVKNNGQGFLGHTLALQTEHAPLASTPTTRRSTRPSRT